MKALKTEYRNLRKLKAATIDLLNEQTDGMKANLNLVTTILGFYRDVFPAVPNPDGESIDEFPSLITRAAAIDPGKLSFSFSGSQLWIENGTYGTKNPKRYKWETYKNRDRLKALGFRWSPNHEAWYYNRQLARNA